MSAVNTFTILNTFGKLATVKIKFKGVFAYVSNFSSQQYNRLKAMKELSKYINADIYGGCTGCTLCSHKSKTSWVRSQSAFSYNREVAKKFAVK